MKTQRKKLSTPLDWLLIALTAIAFATGNARADDKSYSEYRAQYEKGILTLHEHWCYRQAVASGVEHTTAIALCFDVRRHEVEGK